jgi:hypothetical protein
MSHPVVSRAIENRTHSGAPSERNPHGVELTSPGRHALQPRRLDELVQGVKDIEPRTRPLKFAALQAALLYRQASFPQ